MFDFVLMAQQCAPDIHPDTLTRIVHVESAFNPYAIGVVRAHLVRQPRSRAEAIVTARELERTGYNFSVGLAQINISNFQKYGLTLETAFEPCVNLRAGANILKDCFLRARQLHPERDEQTALRDALSCYYSGSLRSAHSLAYVRSVTGDTKQATQLGVKTQNDSGGSSASSNHRRDSAQTQSSRRTPSALLF